MAKESGLGQQFYMAGYDLSNDLGQMNECATPHETLPVTGIDKSAIERLLSRQTGVIDFTTFFNDAALKEHAALKGLPTADVIAIYATGAAIDDPAAGLVGKQQNYDGDRDPVGNFTFNVRVMNNSTPLEWGVMLTSGQDTHSSSTSSSSKDDAASSSNGLAGYLQVIDIDSGTPTFVLEDSANNSTWATLISFTAVADGGEPTAERKEVSGTIDRYLRATTTGTFSNLDFAFMYRRGEAADQVAYA